MPTTPFDVVPYSIDTLNQILSENSEALPDTISGKRHSIYFREYFDAIGAKSIIVENDYIDHDFLDDFAGYYVRCFHPYRHRCVRLHFFSRVFNREEFEQLLTKVYDPSSGKLLQEHYLGFLVIKPLPETIIGRTCLKTYPPAGRRNFLTRSYEAHLFGFTLEVETLAFQEQDSVAAACATSALWSLFHGTDSIFHHLLPSPVEITKSATISSPLETRSLPNRGLTVIQMADAIRSLSLEPLLIVGNNEYIDNDLLRGALYAYIRGRIPVLMNVALIDCADDPPSLMGYHAVTVTGYSLGLSRVAPRLPTRFLSKSSRIDKIYVHDDQIGPYARICFDEKTVSWEGEERDSLSTSWIGSDGEEGNVRIIPNHLLIGLYNKVRIPFEAVEETVIAFDSFLREIDLTHDLEWDIYISMSTDIKEEVLFSQNIDDSVRREVLLDNWPRFLWRATANNASVAVLDLLFRCDRY